MTCIVALEHAGAAWIGSDSFMGSADVRDQTDRPKFFARAGMAIGFAGSFRGAQLIEHRVQFRPIKTGEDAQRYLVVEVARKIRSSFSREGAAIRTIGEADSHDAEMLVCLQGQVWTIQDDYSVIRSAHGFAAIGAGQLFALGALAASSPKAAPRARLMAALRAAAKLSPQVSGPFHVAEVT